MRHLKTFASATALFAGLVAGGQAAQAADGQGDAQSCRALAGRAIAPDTVIESAEYLPEGGAVGTTRIGVPFCRLVGLATPTSDSRIGFEVWLPPKSQWNGNFRGEGSGGSAGAISPGPCGTPSQRAMPPCPPTMAISPTPRTRWAAAARAGPTNIRKR